MLARVKGVVGTSLNDLRYGCEQVGNVKLDLNSSVTGFRREFIGVDAAKLLRQFAFMFFSFVFFTDGYLGVLVGFGWCVELRLEMLAEDFTALFFFYS